jgi:hypothetical protein
MRWIKRGILTIIVLMLALFLHYTLPRFDVVRIINTEVKRTDVGSGWFWTDSDTSTGNNQSRDVRFVNAVFPDGDPIVYRNEDTLWGWPPYFKFDGADIAAEAAALASSEASPVWVAMRHYGWRSTLFNIFPNVTSMKAVAGPDVRVVPWFSIIFVILLCGTILALYRFFILWRRRRIDPVVAALGEAVGEGVDDAQAAPGRLWRWLRRG